MTSYLSDDQVKTLREQYATGDYTMPALAKEWGIHIRTVESLLHHRTRKEAGGPPYQRRRVFVKVTPEDERDIIFLYKCGARMEDIARKFPEYGIHRVGYTIRKYRKRAKEDASS